MTTRVPLMAGNWKMNLDHLEANHLVQGLAMALQDDNHDYTACEVLVLPPFTDIRTVQTIVDADDLDIKYGAQDVSVHDNGAYTGEVSASMLTKLGCTYVVVGHSERREYHGESDALVGAKARKTLDTGMIPIMCCGEALEALRIDYGDTTADAVRILYGGSAKPGNIKELMAQADVDGALVGGASLKADSFAAMANFYA